ncbi:putative periplasmic colicin Js sensitivity protein CjrB [Escherichia coli]|nr:putative periplasmic colicin Js sensitivity protein CjrB [Escherichia coli]
MMNILHFSQSVKWSSWFICSLLLHGLIFLAFIWRFSEVQPAMSPAPAIMLQWAEIIEAPSSPLSLSGGNRSTGSPQDRRKGNKLRTDNNVLSLKTVMQPLK